MYAYKKLKKLYGSDNKIAAALSVSRQSIQYWKKNGVPLIRAKQIESATCGKVTVADVMRG